MITHASDCAVHNLPALPIGPCDCGAAERLMTAAPKLLSAVEALIPCAIIAAEMLSAVGEANEAAKISKVVELAKEFKNEARGDST
jgi:hypothetical protein